MNSITRYILTTFSHAVWLYTWPPHLHFYCLYVKELCLPKARSWVLKEFKISFPQTSYTSCISVSGFLFTEYLHANSSAHRFFASLKAIQNALYYIIWIDILWIEHLQNYLMSNTIKKETYHTIIPGFLLKTEKVTVLFDVIDTRFLALLANKAKMFSEAHWSFRHTRCRLLVK